MRSLEDKVALVTGGARGIGAAVCERLAADGAKVAFTYVQSDEKAAALVARIASLGGRALAIRGDVAVPQDVARSVADAVEAFGPVDILVNNAGLQISGLVETYPIETLDRMIAVNIRGVVLMIQAVLRDMPDGGRIINMGSVSSDYMPLTERAIYAMTKGAVASLTRGLARDLGPRGITVNNVQPGRIETKLMLETLGPLAEQVKSTVALKRFGDVREAAALVSFLAGPDASSSPGRICALTVASPPRSRTSRRVLGSR